MQIFHYYVPYVLYKSFSTMEINFFFFFSFHSYFLSLLEEHLWSFLTKFLKAAELILLSSKRWCNPLLASKTGSVYFRSLTSYSSAYCSLCSMLFLRTFEPLNRDQVEDLFVNKCFRPALAMLTDAENKNLITPGKVSQTAVFKFFSFIKSYV